METNMKIFCSVFLLARYSGAKPIKTLSMFSQQAIYFANVL